MKITHLETLCLSRLHEPERQWITARYRTIKADCAIVVIHTDEGLTGIGEASAYGWPLLIQEWVDWLAPSLVGRDPRDPAIVPHPNGLSRPYDAAVGGIDCALWDLRGQIEGKRVSELLADQPLERVRLYASSGCRYDWRHNPEQLIEEALGYIDQGFTAMKFRIGTEWRWDGVTVDRFLGLVRELAQAVNGRMELMLDGNCRLTEEQALPIAQELDRLGFTWFEEPIPREEIDGYARLCAAVDMPITGGETFTTLEQFRPYLERRAYDIVQPDAGLCGLTECMRIAEAAQRYGVELCPHSWHNGLMAMAHAHLLAALPNPRMLELCMIQGPLQWAILAEPPRLEQGHLWLPERPGLGVELAENLTQRFPYIEGHYAITVER
ncbi:mandelate racemase/muconate lactonizing enzyme family protein [Litorilinea aerophila]|uniref:glucarate dehydratase n=1 Tax=Litorilinea aerophila TaxID=1204385 RepID=A0A540VIE6_9CHLR|nr:mandelate racemase/muconate lactonizing enzyme family protein [Litorilinea aerophila]MCC9075772.1 mandelate racemase/muconate lactonizing enzyme family protein [Litorilinea aerophila]